jgi:leucyl/phenylalanyl-tRNA--protein transferase
MPVFRLPKHEVLFPPVELAEPDGILAVGGDLSVPRLLEAYRNGIFPWYSEGQPIMWWSPDPRMVLFPSELHVSRSMRRVLNSGIFEITVDRAFREVMLACAALPRPGQDGTWITKAILESYCELHRLGHAHSVEAWKDGFLAGGLYGVMLGRVFYGESMFTREPNASRAAFIPFVKRLERLGFPVIDSQVHTAHLESLGGRLIPRTDFLGLVKQGLTMPEVTKGELENLVTAGM